MAFRAKPGNGSVRTCACSNSNTATKTLPIGSGGLDKTLIEIEAEHLPAADFMSSENSMCVILFAPRPFNQMSKAEKMRAFFAGGKL
jgi:hypothetical protein